MANAPVSRGELHRAPSRGSLRPTSTTPSSRSLLLGPARQPVVDQSKSKPLPLLSRANSVLGSRAGSSSTSRPGADGGQPNRSNSIFNPTVPRSSGGMRTRTSPVAEPAAYKSQSLRGMSRIPRPAIPALGDDASDYTRRRMLFDINRDVEEQLANERAAVNELLKELKMMAKATESLNEEVATAHANAEEANARADKTEVQLREQKAENAILKKKIEALSEIIHTQTTVCGDGLPSPDRSHGVSAGLMARQSNGAESDSSDWQANHAHMVSAIGTIHANCTLAQPESEMDPSIRHDLATVERYLERTANTDLPDIRDGVVGDLADASRDGEDFLAPPPNPRRAVSNNSGVDEAYLPVSSRASMPQQRWMAEQEDRAMRRRSTMLFAGLIRPSVGSSAPPGSEQALPLQALDEDGEQQMCGRCEQLSETLQALELDNDYYREANKKLRSSVTDITSRHNALVHIFERERTRRMDARASALARASQIAVRDRAQLEAQQRAEISGGSGPAPSLGVAY
ncbi:hypothetical protein GGI23_002751 [Coemansia sp. RSA 2559]|nr:hypothetical protein GGI23_002751 [Coemansia sp. RSA 2559]